MEYHNSGTKVFMERLAQLMCGYQADVVPAYIDIKAGEKSVLLQPVTVTGVVWGSAADSDLSATDRSCPVLCNAVILDSDLNHTNIPQGNVECSAVLLSRDGVALAKSTHGSILEMVRSISSDTDGLIDWIMCFSTGEM